MSTGSASRVSCTGRPPTAAIPFGYSLRWRSISSPCSALREVRYALDGPAPPGKTDQRSPTHAGVTAIGSRLMPLMKLERKPLDRAVEPCVADPRQQLLEEDLELHACQLSTEAQVRAHPSEGNVLVGRAVDVEPVRVGKLALVVVGRDEPDHDLVAALDLPIVQRDVGGRGAPKVHRDRAPPQDLFDGGLHQSGLPAITESRSSAS